MTGSRSLPDVWRQLEELWRSLGFTPWPASGGALPDPLLDRRLYFALFSESPLAAWTAPELFRAAEARLGGEASRVLERVLHLVRRPAPREGAELLVESLGAIGIDLGEHDFRAVARRWRHEELGLAREGWSARVDGTEVARAVWLREAAGVVLEQPCFELWLWLERVPVVAPREVEAVWDAELDWATLRRDEETEVSAVLLSAAKDGDRGPLDERFELSLTEAERALSMDAPRAAWPSVVTATILLESVRRVRPEGAPAAHSSRLAEAVVRCTDLVRRDIRAGTSR